MNLQVELDKINLRIEETQKEIGVAQDALIDVDEGKTKEKAKAAAKLARLNVRLDDLKADKAKVYQLYDKGITSVPQQAPGIFI